MPPTGLAPVEVTLKQRGCATTTSFLHHRRKAGGIVNIMHLIADAPWTADCQKKTS
jgi:hypothetical protein